MLPAPDPAVWMLMTSWLYLISSTYTRHLTYPTAYFTDKTGSLQSFCLIFLLTYKSIGKCINYNIQTKTAKRYYSMTLYIIWITKWLTEYGENWKGDILLKTNFLFVIFYVQKSFPLCSGLLLILLVFFYRVNVHSSLKRKH